MKYKLKQPYWNGSKWIAAGREIEVTAKKAKEIQAAENRKPVKEFKRSAAYEEE